METIAVYWEARVKVYGITERSGLAMLALRFPAERLAYWSERLVEIEASLGRFELVTCHGASKDRMELFLVLEPTVRDALLNLINGWLDREESAQVEMGGPVELVFLHGPHFQDRFGIAETAFSALEKSDLETVLSGCAGTSMYFVFAEGKGSPAMKVLSDTFIIPINA